MNLLEPDEASDVTTAKLGRCPGCGCRPESDDAFEFVELLISEPQPWAITAAAATASGRAAAARKSRGRMGRVYAESGPAGQIPSGPA